MNAAIIGGGIGGLVSALFLSKQGVDVTIYEKEGKLGGRLAFEERDGFRIDQGPTIVLLPEMFQQLLDEAGVDRASYELVRCDPLYSIQFPDGLHYTKYPDLDRQLDEVRRLFPSEVGGFQRFIEEGRERFTQGKQAFLEKAFVNHRDFWTGSNVKTLLKLKAHQSVRKLMSSYFQDERLKTAYSLQTLYIGGDPFHAPAMYSLVPFSEHEHGVYYLKGGYASLVPILEEELKKRGVDIYLNTAVTNIHSDGKRVMGVETKGGFHSFDTVIFNGDFPAIAQVMKQKERRSFTPSSGCVLLYFGLDRIYNDVNIHQFFIGENFHEHMKAVFERNMLPNDPAFYTFHPSIIDDSLAPEGKGVLYTLVPVPSATNISWSEQTDWIEKIIDRMEQLSFPRLREAIQWMEIRTPTDAEQFGLFGGGSFGIAPTLFQSGVFRPQVKPYPLENLYAVGASIHPGGGIPIVMQGAKLMVDQWVRDQALKGEGVHA
ncbi:phytoene desaturase family protein [Bacillus sp. REN10]|uniref:phytoene desaturase family protein n=1 Tax=Bacillus sp. REN10 TaxID=2782541 RepID=UPI00193BACE4|nr:phytoene desaturase family protein [Bacillus sp. REN10]